MPAEEMLMECTESALQTIEDGPLPEVQRCMLMLSAMLTGASVDHGRRPVLVSLSTFSPADTEILTFSAAADTKKLKNGMDNDNQATEEWPATRTPDFKMAETLSSEIVNKGSQKAAAHPAFSPFVPVVSK